MGQLTKAFCEQMLTHATRKEHAPLTIWEEEQLARAWLRLNDLTKPAAGLAARFLANWRHVAEFFASRNWPDTTLGRAANDLHGDSQTIAAALAASPHPAMPTAKEISDTLQLFRRELDKNMHNSSGSPGHDAMTVALYALFKSRGCKP